MTYLKMLKKIWSELTKLQLVCFQGFIGWYMVSSGLIDRVDVSHYRLSLHLVTAFIILSVVFWKFLNLTDLKINQINIKFNSIKLFLLLLFLFQYNDDDASFFLTKIRPRRRRKKKKFFFYIIIENNNTNIVIVQQHGRMARRNQAICKSP